MLVQIVTENGQKKVIPLTADAGAGNPVGTIVSMYKKSSPSGCLYCDGSTFDQTKYPLLYAYLGSNVLPDYREFALVGAEENTTDVYNASTNPTGTIHDHDVYTEGEAKDDQVQEHNHQIANNTGAAGENVSINYIATGLRTGGEGNKYTFNNTTTGRKGTTTRGKRKAVYFYIKATSGLSENAQDNVINTLNEERSYSTEEVNTGKKWIDGKPIYRKVYTDTMGVGTKTFTIPNDINVISIDGVVTNSSGVKFPIPYFISTPTGNYGLYIYIQDTNLYCLQYDINQSYYQGGTIIVILEYTKTTD